VPNETAKKVLMKKIRRLPVAVDDDRLLLYKDWTTLMMLLVEIVAAAIVILSLSLSLSLSLFGDAIHK
jgi:hypothetical protein